MPELWTPHISIIISEKIIIGMKVIGDILW